MEPRGATPFVDGINSGHVDVLGLLLQNVRL